MKRYIAITALLGILVCLFSGCGFWMDGERISVEPYQQSGDVATKEVTAVTNYMQLRNAVVEFVEKGAERGVISAADFIIPSVHFYVDMAIRYVKNTHPVGAYALKDVTYEIGTNAGETAIALKFRYRIDRSAILHIDQADNMQTAFSVIGDALSDCEPYVVIRVPAYEETDLVQWVRDYAALHPDVVMEVPDTEAAVYPQQGSDRIIELAFTYQSSRESLLNMQNVVEPVFTAAELYVKNAVQAQEKYAQLYSFLMERSEYKLVTSITPAYSLLNHGVGDCKAFANVYAAMCRKAGLECYAIFGTRDGEPWTWNLIKFNGSYYHLDLLRSAENGEFTPVPAPELTGYVWDYSAYPD